MLSLLSCNCAARVRVIYSVLLARPFENNFVMSALSLSEFSKCTCAIQAIHLYLVIYRDDFKSQCSNIVHCYFSSSTENQFCLRSM